MPQFGEHATVTVHNEGGDHPLKRVEAMQPLPGKTPPPSSAYVAPVQGGPSPLQRLLASAGATSQPCEAEVAAADAVRRGEGVLGSSDSDSFFLCLVLGIDHWLLLPSGAEWLRTGACTLMSIPLFRAALGAHLGVGPLSPVLAVVMLLFEQGDQRVRALPSSLRQAVNNALHARHTRVVPDGGAPPHHSMTVEEVVSELDAVLTLLPVLPVVTDADLAYLRTSALSVLLGYAMQPVGAEGSTTTLLQPGNWTLGEPEDDATKWLTPHVRANQLPRFTPANPSAPLAENAWQWARAVLCRTALGASPATTSEALRIRAGLLEQLIEVVAQSAANVVAQCAASARSGGPPLLSLDATLENVPRAALLENPADPRVSDRPRPLALTWPELTMAGADKTAHLQRAREVVTAWAARVSAEGQGHESFLTVLRAGAEAVSVLVPLDQTAPDFKSASAPELETWMRAFEGTFPRHRGTASSPQASVFPYLSVIVVGSYPLPWHSLPPRASMDPAREEHERRASWQGASLRICGRHGLLRDSRAAVSRYPPRAHVLRLPRDALLGQGEDAPPLGC